ncbi:hypothetical protein ACFVH7_12375 [Kitasatospora indigofera]|uniref:hypothetical protein n=1 Tax=Kitasatospora indigofera TaxID=67307 RepID=UPI00362CC211
MRDLASRLDALSRTLPATLASGSPVEVAWPLLHLVGVAASATDEVFFRVADAKTPAGTTAVAALAGAVARTAEALAVLAAAAQQQFLSPGTPSAAEQMNRALIRTEGLITLAAREATAAADGLSTDAPVAGVRPLHAAPDSRTAQSLAALARSRPVTTPAAESAADPAPTAQVIPLRRNR